MRVARRLGELPLIRGRFARGELSYSKVRALTRIAAPENEARLLEVARDSTAAQLERVASAYRRALPDADSGAQADRRYARAFWDDDGSLVISARLAPEEGALVRSWSMWMLARSQRRDPR